MSVALNKIDDLNTFPTPASAKAVQVLDAARNVFLRFGFSATTTDMIQEAAGVSKSTIYAHFASKDELFLAVIRAECRDFLEKTKVEEVPGETIRETLIRRGRRFLEVALSPSALELHRIVIAESSRFQKIGEVLYEAGVVPCESDLAIVLAKACRRAGIRLDSPMKAASFFLNVTLNDIQMRCLLGLSPLPSTEEIDAIVTEAVDRFIPAFGLCAFASTPVSTSEQQNNP